MRYIHNVCVEACERRVLLSTYTVNTTSDSASPGPGLLTLREAVADANANPGTNTIAFSSTAFPPGGSNTITLTQGELSLTNNMNIQGPGAGVLSIDGNKSSRVFQISSGVTVSISGLTITDGAVTSAPGTTATGGGVLNAGTLNLTNVTVSNSAATGGTATANTVNDVDGGNAEGGAIYSTGTLTLLGSEFSGDSAQGGGGSQDNGLGGNSFGGGIYSVGPLTISASSVSGNTSAGGENGGYVSGGNAQGGGIWVSGALSMNSTKVENNSASGNSIPGLATGNGGSASGGGIQATGSSEVTDSTFTNNQAFGGTAAQVGGDSGPAWGGAIFTSDSLSITASTFTGNDADGGNGPGQDNGAGSNGYGGAIASKGSLTVTSSTLNSNSVAGGDESYAPSIELFASGLGGGIYSAGTLILSSSSITGNAASGGYGGSYGNLDDGGYGRGGGLFTSGSATVTASSVTDNISQGGAGGVSAYDDRGGNGGDGEGAGFYNGGALTITNSTLSGNAAEGGAGANGSYEGTSAGNGGDGIGAAIYSTDTLTLDDTTVSGNTTAGAAGGMGTRGYANGTAGTGLAAVTIASGGAVFNNTIISGNTANGTTEDDIQGTASISSASNLIGVGGGLTNGVNGNIVGVNNPDLSPLQYNGGPTETLYPLSGSPAISAGNSSLIPSGVTTDQRGDSRIVGSSVDIGSVETAGVSISGTVYYDNVGAGTNLSSDGGDGGVTVYADLNNSGHDVPGDPSTTTASNGTYTLYGVPPGAQIIREVLQGARQSYPAGGGGEHVTVGSTPLTGVNFAQTGNLYVSGTVTVNGVGQRGVLVYAIDQNDAVAQSTLTGTGGTYALYELNPADNNNFIIFAAPAGNYVRQSLPEITTGEVIFNENFSFTTPPPAYLTGTLIATSGSYQNDGNTAANAVDGNLNTFFDGPTANGNFVGLELGTPTVIRQISYAPRPGWASRMVGGIFQGSNSANFANATTLYTVTQAPAAGVLTSVSLSNTTSFRYVRYLAPAGSYGDVAEVQFFIAVQPNVAIGNGTLTVTGTQGNDDITITDMQTVALSPTSNVAILSIVENGVTEDFNAYYIQSIAVHSLGGNDTIAISDATVDDLFQTQDDLTFTVTAGDGNDTVSTDSTHQDVISLGNGNDSISVNNGGYATITAGNGDDQIDVNPNDYLQLGGAANITLGNGNSAVTLGNADGPAESISINVGAGNNVIQNQSSDNQATLTVAGAAPITVDILSLQLTGKVFVDSNGDGQVEAGEPGLANAQVYVDLGDSGHYVIGDPLVTTDSAGNYVITDLDFPDETVPSNLTIRLMPVAAYTVESQDEAIQTTLTSSFNGSFNAYTGFNFAMRPTQTQLTGTVIGTSSSYDNQGNTAAKAFDGNLNSFFDAPTASGSWAGLDLGSAMVVTSISYAPRSGWAGRMVGGMFQASNSPAFSSGVVTLYTVTSTPATGVLTTVTLSNTLALRYVRYIDPANSYCNIAEAEFFGTVPAKLTGAVIGTPGSYENQGNVIANVFDGNLSTFFDAPNGSGDWAGLDLGSAELVTEVEYAPRPGWASRMVGGEIQASNSANFSSGVVTLFTISSTPATGVLTTQLLTNTTAYRYYRYIGPANSFCNIAELELFA